MSSNTPSNGKCKPAAGPGPSLRITPSNSPLPRPAARSPNKPSAHQTVLALQTVIGTTTVAPNGFSSHDESRSFAFCAGSAAVLAELDDDNNVHQRFFRARPSATSVNPVTSFYHQPTPPSTPDPRARSTPIKSNAHASGLHNGSPSNDWAESGSPRGWSSRERIKAVTSVSLSPNGRFLAMGETGYNPRVMIYSTAKDSSPDIPLSILNEHTFGVRNLAFSSNSQHLASLGNVNDGFLFIWAVSLKNGSARLHSTNKCTALVKDMCWMGQTLVTAGVRHVKVWRLTDQRPGSPGKSRLNPESAAHSSNPTPKALSGRNCVLGALGESTFTCAASISDTEAVLGTDTGALCLLDDSAGSQKLSLVQHVGFNITSLAADSDGSCVWIGGRGRKMEKFSVDSLRSASSPGPPTSPGPRPKPKGLAITCMGSLSSHLVTLDSSRVVNIYPFDSLDGEDDESSSSTDTTMPAHRDSVLGIRSLKGPNELKADFFTWSCKGTVHFWDTNGKCRASRTIPVDKLPSDDDDVSNELKTVAAAEDLDFYVSGDKLGVLRVMSAQPWMCVNKVRAHGGEITDIAIHSDPDSGAFLIASSGRDRMIQLFQKRDESIELIQTMDDHVGAVGQLLFSQDGEKLLSCSSDRTILIRNRVTREEDGTTAVAYLISKTVTLKSSPVSMTFSPDDSNILVVSTMDRCIQIVDLPSGRAVHAFRAADSESPDAVVMGALTVATEIPGQSPRVLVGVSSTDKSIRVYDMDRDLLLTGEFGHAEGVSDVLLLENPQDTPDDPVTRTLISVGIDGVVMIWSLTVQPHQSQDPVQSSSSSRDDDDAPTKTASKPPIRRILSKSELAGFQKQDPSAVTPTPVRESSSSLVRKMSKLSLKSSSLRNGHASSSTPSPPNSSRRSPTYATPHARQRRSPSTSPKSTPTPTPTPAQSSTSTSTPTKKMASRTSSTRRTSLEFRSRTRHSHSHQNDTGSLTTSTEQVCRTLRAYRKKLHGSSEHLRSQRELERELSLTLRSLGSHNKNFGDGQLETETDSSGRENEQIFLSSMSSGRTLRIPHLPSTPELGQKSSREDCVCRSRSIDEKG